MSLSLTTAAHATFDQRLNMLSNLLGFIKGHPHTRKRLPPDPTLLRPSYRAVDVFVFLNLIIGG